jgi:hypothetical protein
VKNAHGSTTLPSFPRSARSQRPLGYIHRIFGQLHLTSQSLST